MFFIKDGLTTMAVMMAIGVDRLRLTYQILTEFGPSLINADFPLSERESCLCRGAPLPACRITNADDLAVYGNLFRFIHAFSKCGTLFTVSNRPRKRIRRTGRENVSRNPLLVTI